MPKDDVPKPKDGILQKLIEFESRVSEVVAHPYALVSVLLLILIWLVSGLIIQAELNHWKEIIHIPIFVTTFVLLFILQSSQKHDTEALHAKLDEIIDSMPRTDKRLIKLEKKLKGDK